MSLRSRTLSLFRNLIGRAGVERELDDEVRSVLELLVEEKQEAGLTPDEARRAALLELGGIEQVKEQVREARTGATLETLGRDLAYAARTLRRNAGFTAVATATLALGIGASTAVFSVVDTVVFRPLPYQEPDRLVKLCGTTPLKTACDDDFSWPELLEARGQSQLFEQVAADDGTRQTLTRPDGSRESLGVALVTTNWLATLGVTPLLGRDFVPGEDRPGRDRVVLLTQDYWRRRFEADPHVVGRTVTLDGSPCTVIGVLPPNVLRTYADVVRPLDVAGYSDGRRDLDVFGRLLPRVTLTRARAELGLVGQRLERQSPATNARRRLGAQALGKYYAATSGDASRGLLLMLGAVSMLLLIACANVANLLLARAAGRQRECVIRAALGASRGRLVRQLLIENLLLFLIGGGLGLLLASASLRSLTELALAGGYLPERMTVALDARVLLVGLVVSLLTGLAFGLAPALEASRVDLLAGLRDASPTLQGLRGRRTRRLLIVAELALSLVLLTGFGLLIRSFARIHAASGGFDPENLLLTDAEGGRSFPEAVAFWRSALEGALAIPGVRLGAVTSRPPVHEARRQRFVVEGGSRAPADAIAEAGDVLVSPDYFETMRIPLLRGRAFSEHDDDAAPAVAVISQGLARRYFPGVDPIGRRLQLDEHSPMSCCSAGAPVEGAWREVVGIVGDVRQANLDAEPAMTIYRPYTQVVEHDMYLLVRTHSARELEAVARELRARLLAGQPNGEWSEVRSMRAVIRQSESIRLRRFVLILLGSFACVALLLAAVGTYGVTACAVAERTQEIGLRMALGATRPVVFRQVLQETLALALAGLVLGALAALAATRLISASLFGISPTDVSTYLGVALLLGAVVLIAGYVPALRATQVDPIRALRHE